MAKRRRNGDKTIFGYERPSLFRIAVRPVLPKAIGTATGLGVGLATQYLSDEPVYAVAAAAIVFALGLWIFDKVWG